MALTTHEKFGSETPFAEPAWYRGAHSPHYNSSHIAFRAKVRKFVEEEVKPYVDEWEEDHLKTGFEFPVEVLRKAYEAGIYAAQWPKEIGGTPPAGDVPFDPFHDLILIDELGRIGAAGIIACFTIYTMALPPILAVGSDYIKSKVVQDVVSAKKFISSPFSS